MRRKLEEEMQVGEAPPLDDELELPKMLKFLSLGHRRTCKQDKIDFCGLHGHDAAEGTRHLPSAIQDIILSNLTKEYAHPLARQDLESLPSLRAMEASLMVPPIECLLPFFGLCAPCQIFM